jgi:MFS family permease
MLPFLLGTVVGASTSGRLVARIVHYKRIAAFGLVLSTLCVIVLGLVASEASLLVVNVLLTLIGIGMGTMFPVGTVSVQNAVDHAHLGVATGVLAFLRSLGSALGVAALGAVALGYGLPLARETAQVVVAPAMAGAAFAAIFFASAAILAACVGALFLMPEKPLRGRASEKTRAAEG